MSSMMPGSKAAAVPEKKPGEVAMPTAEWMFADAGAGILGFEALAHLNPLRWSGPLPLKDVVKALEDLIKHVDGKTSEAKSRPILMKCPANTGSGTEYKNPEEAIKFLNKKLEGAEAAAYSQKLKDQCLKAGATILEKLPKQITEKLDQVDLKGVPKEFIALGVALLPVLILMFVAPELILLLVGTGYPAYASLLCLAENKEVHQWITYWIFFTLISFGPMAYIISWIPFNYYLKMFSILFLCFSPKGSQILIDKVMKPYIFPMIATPKSG
jgi:hypothetical protein